MSDREWLATAYFVAHDVRRCDTLAEQIEVIERALDQAYASGKTVGALEVHYDAAERQRDLMAGVLRGLVGEPDNHVEQA